MLFRSADMAARKAYAKKNSVKDVQASNDQNALANAWRIEGVSLKADETADFAYDRQSLDAKFDLVIDGYGSAGVPQQHQK